VSTTSTAAQVLLTTTIAQALWVEYGYPSTLGPWESVSPYIGLDPARAPADRSRAALAVNRCIAAAGAVLTSLRSVPIGHLHEALSEALAPDHASIFAPIHAWTDGSGTTDNSPAGAGVVLRFHDPVPHEVAFGTPLGQGTNNYAELSGILLALRAITGNDRLRPVVVHSDSTYAIGAASGRNKVNANADLIREIRLQAKGFRDLTFKHVPAHSGIPENERADKLAGRAAKTQTEVSES